MVIKQDIKFILGLSVDGYSWTSEFCFYKEFSLKKKEFKKKIIRNLKYHFYMDVIVLM